MSVPGGVAKGHFGYMQVVFGYLLGYWIIAFVLLPLYYRLQLTSIYSYLLVALWQCIVQNRGLFLFDFAHIGGQHPGVFGFKCLQIFMLDAWHVPFAVTVGVILLMILLYTI